MQKEERNLVQTERLRERERKKYKRDIRRCPRERGSEGHDGAEAEVY